MCVCVRACMNYVSVFLSPPAVNLNTNLNIFHPISQLNVKRTVSLFLITCRTDGFLFRLSHLPRSYFFPVFVLAPWEGDNNYNRLWCTSLCCVVLLTGVSRTGLRQTALAGWGSGFNISLFFCFVFQSRSDHWHCDSQSTPAAFTASIPPAARLVGDSASHTHQIHLMLLS